MTDAELVSGRAGLLADLDPEARARLVRAWDGAMRDDLRGVEAAVAANDLAAVGFLAHRMAGSSSTVGALALAALCRDLERSARAGVAATPGDVEAIRRHCTLAGLELGLARYPSDR